MDAPKYLPPLDPELALRVESLTEDQMEWWTERCAIREYAGGLPRAEAESEAWSDTVRHFGLATRTDADAQMASTPRRNDRK